MGRTQKPLRILVDSRLVDRPEIQALREKGHQIVVDPLLDDEEDLVLGPTCWRMDESMLDYLELAIKGARTVKYPPKERSEHTSEARAASVE